MALSTNVNAKTKTITYDYNEVDSLFLQTLEVESDVTCLNLASLTFDLNCYSIEDQIPIPYCSLIRKCPNVTDFQVSSDNEKLKVIDGNLYDKKGETLICCPPGKTGTVVVPEGVNTICSFAFANCNKITEIQLPSSLYSINSGCFYGTTSLRTIKISDENEYFIVVDNVLYSGTEDPKYVDILLFPAADPRTSFTVQKPVAQISCSAFAFTKNLRKIDLSKGVSVIDDHAFEGSGISHAKTSNKICYIGIKAFKDCVNLSSYSIKEKCTDILTGAFYNTPQLKELYLPDSITTFSVKKFKEGGMNKKIKESSKNL